MFLRAHHRTKDGKRHTRFALVESVRTERGPRQHIVAQLGELGPDDQHRWQRTAIFHTRHQDHRQLPLFLDDEHAPLPDDPDVVRVRLGKVGWTNARAFGDVWLGLQLWRMLGLDSIVARHVPTGRETVPPASMVAIEVIARLCVSQGLPTSEFALAEQGYRRTALEDLLGVPDAQVTKDRLYRTLDQLLAAKEGIERDLKESLGELFNLNFDLLLCDLTSSFFEGLAEENELAARGYSRDHRPDCKQVVLALIVTPDGFPLYHEVFAGNTNDAVAFPKIVETMETRFGSARRVWVLDRGIASEANLNYLRERKQSYLVGTPRSRLSEFEAELCLKDWAQVREQVEVKVVAREGQTYVLARSKARRAKEKAIRSRQLRGLHADLRKLTTTVAAGKLKQADKAWERIGRYRERWPAAARFVLPEVARNEQGRVTRVTWRWDAGRLRAALARDGAYLLLSDQTDWTPEQLWATYMQLTRAESAFRTLKSDQLLRPIWHQYSGRVQAHIFVCVLAYALYKALEHLLRRASVMTEIRKPDPSRPQASPKDRPMSPAEALRRLHDIPIGDILLETTEGRTLRLRRVARPNAEQAALLTALGLRLPERICADHEVGFGESSASPVKTGAVSEVLREAKS
jgi:transposase